MPFKMHFAVILLRQGCPPVFDGVMATSHAPVVSKITLGSTTLYLPIAKEKPIASHLKNWA